MDELSNLTCVFSDTRDLGSMVDHEWEKLASSSSVTYQNSSHKGNMNVSPPDRILEGCEKYLPTDQYKQKQSAHKFAILSVISIAALWLSSVDRSLCCNPGNPGHL